MCYFNIGGYKYTPANNSYSQSTDMSSPRIENLLKDPKALEEKTLKLKDAFKPVNIETINNPDGSVTTVYTYAGGNKQTQNVKTEIDENGQEHKTTTVMDSNNNISLQIDEVKGKSKKEMFYDKNGNLEQTTNYTYEQNSEGVPMQKTKDNIKYDTENVDKNGKPIVLWEEHDYDNGKSLKVMYGDGSGEAGHRSYATVSTKEGNKAVELNYDMENIDVDRGNVRLDENGQIITKDGSKPKLKSKVTNPGLPTEQTTYYDYDTKDNCIARTYDALNRLISTDFLDKDGNPIFENSTDSTKDTNSTDKANNANETSNSNEAKDSKYSENTYTVNKGESYRNIIIRNLKEQGIQNPTDSEIKEAMANFEERNPGAVKTAKNGVKYLLAGAQVILPRGKIEIKSLQTLDSLKNADQTDVKVQDATKFEQQYDSDVASAKIYRYNGAIIVVSKDNNGDIINIKVSNAKDSDDIVDTVFYEHKILQDADGNYSDGKAIRRSQHFDLNSMLPEWILNA